MKYKLLLFILILLLIINFDKSGSLILWNSNGQKVLQKAVINQLNVSNLDEAFILYITNPMVRFQKHFIASIKKLV